MVLPFPFWTWMVRPNPSSVVVSIAEVPVLRYVPADHCDLGELVRRCVLVCGAKRPACRIGLGHQDQVAVGVHGGCLPTPGGVGHFGAVACIDVAGGAGAVRGGHSQRAPRAVVGVGGPIDGCVWSIWLRDGRHLAQRRAGAWRVLRLDGRDDGAAVPFLDLDGPPEAVEGGGLPAAVDGGRLGRRRSTVGRCKCRW